MSTSPLKTCQCPECGNDWDDVGSVGIVGVVEPADDLLKQAKLGIDLRCTECETQYEVWLPLECFQRSTEVCHVG